MSNGYRLTKARIALSEMVEKLDKPMSALDILKKLRRKIPRINKTTVYRELQFFKEKGLIEEIQLGDSVVRFEKTGIHHHHVVCMKCQKIEDVTLSRELEREEDAIQKKANFKILKHSLEFFGLCAKCI